MSNSDIPDRTRYLAKEGLSVSGFPVDSVSYGKNARDDKGMSVKVSPDAGIVLHLSRGIRSNSSQMF